MASIGFIGTGNMGSAIIKGLSQKGVATAGSDVDQAKLKQLAEEFGMRVASGPADLVAGSRIIVLAVKPQQMPKLLEQIGAALTADKVLVSIAAGLTVARLRELTGQVCPVVRVMPNTPALVGAGVSAITFEGAPELDAASRKEIKDILAAVGEVHELSEKDFDAFTAVVGSGPAYVFAMMDALVEAGVNLGLPRPMADKMVRGLFYGSAKLAVEGGLPLPTLREMVTSPAGTTVRGLNVMDRYAVRAALIDAAEAAWQRSIELGES